MQVNITGGNKFQKKDVEEAAHWVANKIMHLNLHRNINVTINLCKLEDELAGDCTYIDDWVKPREFSIQIKKNLVVWDMVRVLFHEMVHVRQFATSQMKERPVKGHTMTYWEGEIINDLPYEVQPWEIEARTMEDLLTKEYIKYIQNN